MDERNESPPPSTSPRQRIAANLYRSAHVDAQSSAAHSASKNTRHSGQRPSFLVCYLCGQQFGMQSLRIHQPQCYVKSLLIWERTPEGVRGPKPRSPDEVVTSQPEGVGLKGDTKAIDRFNEAQFSKFNDEVLVACTNCGRTFLPDRLAVHQRSCRPGSRAASKPVTASIQPHLTPDKKPSTMPQLEPHQKARSDDLNVGQEEKDNEAAATTAETVQPELTPLKLSPAKVSPPVMPLSLRAPQLVKCSFCSRNFAPDRINYHESVCVERHSVTLTPRRNPLRKSSESPEMNLAASASFGQAKEPAAVARKKVAAPRPQRSDGKSQAKPWQQRFRGGLRAGPGAAPQRETNSPVDRAVTPTELQQQKMNELEKDLKVYDERRITRSPSQEVAGALPDDVNVMDLDRLLDIDEHAPSSVLLHPPPSTTSTVAQQSQSSPSIYDTAPQKARPQEQKRSIVNFCFECGTKLFIPRQKFCHECGSRLPQ